MAKPTVASRARTPQPAPKSYDLTDLQVRHVDGFDQPSIEGERGRTMPADEMALGLDFIGRLAFRRTATEQEEWANGWRLVEYLVGLSELVRRYHVDGFSGDMRTFLAESIEYAAVRVGVALETPEQRMDRWQVSLGAVEAAPKAVAS